MGGGCWKPACHSSLSSCSFIVIIKTGGGFQKQVHRCILKKHTISTVIEKEKKKENNNILQAHVTPFSLVVAHVVVLLVHIMLLSSKWAVCITSYMFAYICMHCHACMTGARFWTGPALAWPLWPWSSEGQGHYISGPDMEGQGQVWQKSPRPGLDWPLDSLSVAVALAWSQLRARAELIWSWDEPGP